MNWLLICYSDFVVKFFKSRIKGVLEAMLRRGRWNLGGGLVQVLAGLHRRSRGAGLLADFLQTVFYRLPAGEELDFDGLICRFREICWLVPLDDWVSRLLNEALIVIGDDAPLFLTQLIELDVRVDADSLERLEEELLRLFGCLVKIHIVNRRLETFDALAP